MRPLRNYRSGKSYLHSIISSARRTFYSRPAASRLLATSGRRFSNNSVDNQYVSWNAHNVVAPFHYQNQRGWGVGSPMIEAKRTDKTSYVPRLDEDISVNEVDNSNNNLMSLRPLSNQFEEESEQGLEENINNDPIENRKANFLNGRLLSLYPDKRLSGNLVDIKQQESSIEPDEKQDCNSEQYRRHGFISSVNEKNNRQKFLADLGRQLESANRKSLSEANQINDNLNHVENESRGGATENRPTPNLSFDELSDLRNNLHEGKKKSAIEKICHIKDKQGVERQVMIKSEACQPTSKSAFEKTNSNKMDPSFVKPNENRNKAILRLRGKQVLDRSRMKNIADKTFTNISVSSQSKESAKRKTNRVPLKYLKGKTLIDETNTNQFASEFDTSAANRNSSKFPKIITETVVKQQPNSATRTQYLESEFQRSYMSHSNIRLYKW